MAQAYAFAIIGNAGIGYCLAALLLADRAKHVIITSRSIEKGKAAMADLLAMGQPGTVDMIQLEVTSPTSIGAAARIVEEKYGRLVIYSYQINL